MDHQEDWDVTVIDGEPELMVNAAVVRRLAKESPYGEERAKEILKSTLPADVYAKVFEEN